ncbi:helix-turn-helix transcriptional regulator [Phytomonospora endophytica]|uniref:Putative DNA-binding transcriptional regulator YafY n=1 Tax=Phytomonospora endophytica TaxID=714109 RepID=A0A841FR65_9ACTN|nr:WYL domain-containing protein [Phytomonospora endophytica]MBB6036042.1 putative DNA-binding transcriptional regulator YafY [Phytomonospora endophytica]GIG66947.1 transcriptional regulator [Phytomonospora endophytica]
MRASRMMTLLLHLQVRGHATGRELSELLEVSERTVQRDVDSLTASGIPIRSTRGPAGGYRLAGGYRTRLTGVGLDEAGALAFLGLAGPAEQLGLGEMLEGARIKVWASLTGEAREQAKQTAERFHLDPMRWYGTPEPVPMLTKLARAAWSDRRARITYVTKGRAGAREVEPLGLVLAAGDWYLVAMRDGERRTYRVSRVTEVELLEERVVRPEGFDLGETWAASRKELEKEATAIEVTLRADAEVLPRLRGMIPVHGHGRVPVTATEPVVLTVPFESESWARWALLGLGATVEVIAPESLREWVSGQFKAAAARY